jgi:hypothetical protein
MTDEHDRLDPELEAALRSLPRERRAEASLEDHVVAKLRSEGLLATPRAARPPRGAWMRIAASIALLALGFTAGAIWTNARPAPAGANPRFLLLLHEPSATGPAPSPEEQRALVDEYKAWAVAGAESGFLLEGEKLKDDVRVLPAPGDGASAPSAGAPFIGGYFVVQAAGYEEASRLAGTCPHLRHGGTIEIREIDPV